MFPDGVETITMSKNDYDRLYGDLTLENIELKQEIDKLVDNIEDLDREFSRYKYESKKEIERLNKELEEYKKDFKETNDYAFKLHSIIKEVREYILQHCEILRNEEKNIDIVGRVEGIPLLEILDKGEE